MKKKSLITLALALVLGLTACGGTGNGKPKNDTVTLQFWGWGDDVEASVFQDITDQFNKTVGKEKGISVKYVQKAASSYSSDTALALSGNNTPDIIYVEDKYVKAWADAGYLAQLDNGDFKGFDFKNENGEIWKSGISRYRFNPETATSGETAPLVRAAYYRVKGNISSTDAAAWGQARILISSDAKNEHVIALEKTDKNIYQIFAMSKNNEEIWQNWTAIVDAEVNKDKNSLDFEVIADGEKVYFLIDDLIYYTSDRVSVEESTVKFASYGNATTTVKNLDGYIFESKEDVQEYLETKSVKEFKGENFGETVGDGITYTTTDGINLETLGLLKQGGTFTFYVNGNQVLTYNSSFTGKTTVGVFGFNTGMTLKEYYVEKK